MSAAIVLHGGADFRGDLVQVAQQVGECQAMQAGMLCHGLVELLHVGRVMAAMMDLQCLLVDVRLERVVRIRQIGERERIGLPECLRRGGEL